MGGKIPLKTRPKKFIDVGVVRTVEWKAALPFLFNPRGYLIHRVRFAASTVIRGIRSHDTATYWCGNCGRGKFVAEPPEERLLCAACEAVAVYYGQPTAEELVGRHICTGRLRAIRVCCQDEGN